MLRETTCNLSTCLSCRDLLYRSSLLKIPGAYTSDMHGQIDEHEQHLNCSIKIFSTVEVKKENEESILSSSVGTKDRSRCYDNSSFIIAFQVQQMSSSVIGSLPRTKGQNDQCSVVIVNGIVIRYLGVSCFYASCSSVFYLLDDLRMFVINEYMRCLGLILYSSLNTFLVLLQ